MKAALVCAVVMLLGGVARADDAFDPEGWTVLGAKSFGTKARFGFTSATDRTFDQVTLLVTGGEVTIDGVIVSMQDGADKLQLSEKHTLDRAHPAWTFDLNQPSAIRSVRIRKATRSSKQGYFQVLARDSSAKTPERRHGKLSAGQPDHWAQIATGSLRGEQDRAVLAAIDRAPVTKLMLAASGADLRISQLAVQFDDGTEWIRGGVTSLDDIARERTFRLGDTPRVIESITFDYVISSGLAVVVDAFGIDADAVGDDPETFDEDGWTLLGEDDVDVLDQELDIDREGTWRQVAIVADGDDVHVDALAVQLAGKADKQQRFTLDADLTAESRARIFDLTGKRRAIQKVRLTYAKHRLDASTRVKVYAR